MYVGDKILNLSRNRAKDAYPKLYNPIQVFYSAFILNVNELMKRAVEISIIGGKYTMPVNNDTCLVDDGFWNTVTQAMRTGTDFAGYDRDIAHITVMGA